LLFNLPIDRCIVPKKRFLILVHLNGSCRLSLSTNKYRVIKLPTDLAECKEGAMSSIGKSGNRVCFAALDKMSQLRVWTLNESGDETEWLLKHHTVVFHPKYEQIRCADAPWTIDSAKEYCDSETEDDEEVSQEDNRNSLPDFQTLPSVRYTRQRTGSTRQSLCRV